MKSRILTVNAASGVSGFFALSVGSCWRSATDFAVLRRSRLRGLRFLLSELAFVGVLV